MTFLIKDDKIFKKYNEIWEKVTNIIYREFFSNPKYNEKYIKTKIEVYNKNVNTNFHGNKIPNEILECVCLSVIFLDSVYRKDNKYFPEVFLEECKYFFKEKKFHNYIIDDVQISSYSDQKDPSEKIQIEKFWLWRKFWWRNYGKNSDGKKFWLWGKFWWRNYGKNSDGKKSLTKKMKYKISSGFLWWDSLIFRA